VKYSYKDGDNYVFMDGDFNQYEISAEFLEDTLKYLEDDMECEIVYTEPAVKGDTSGKVMKLGKLATGHEISIPAFIEIGEKIEIDTRTDEYVSRAK